MALMHPLGLKPTDPTKFADIQTRELQNGRLSCHAGSGYGMYCYVRARVGEPQDHKTIFESNNRLLSEGIITLESINPYASM
jgi:hypothetical protein